jgi:hypothetical protein
VNPNPRGLRGKEGRAKEDAMSMRFDQERKRIICRWEEPTKVVMNKKEGLINRSRMITVKVNDNGKLNSKDRKRHADHPMFPIISRFNQMLNSIECYPKCENEYRCAVCGATRGVSPHFDTESQSIVWLCKEHLDNSPKLDA